MQAPRRRVGGMEKVLGDVQRAGLVEQTGGTYLWLFAYCSGRGALRRGRRPTGQGLEYCSDHGLELFRLYLLSYRARLYLAQGRWAQAAETADVVLRIPRTSINPRITALTVLGLVRARRGDPGHRAVLDEAWDLAGPTVRYIGLAPRSGPPKPLGSAATLEGVASATELALALALKCSTALADELAVWRHRAGLGAAKPLAPGSPSRSAARRVLGCGPGLVARGRVPLRGRPLPGRRRRRGAAAAGVGGAAGARGPPGCGDRGPTAARPRRDVVPRGPRATTRQNQTGSLPARWRCWRW